MRQTSRGPTLPDPNDPNLEPENAELLMRMHDRVRLEANGIAPMSPTLNLRQGRALQQLGLIEIVNAGRGDQAFFTQAGLDLLPTAAQIVSARKGPSA